ncbi:MAG: hypothetical protein RL291_947 [Pseudomonadota bacterium]
MFARVIGARVLGHLALTLLGLAALVGVQPHEAQALDGYLNRKRPLLIFSPSDSNPNYVRQKNAINGNRIGISDREIVVVYVIGSAIRTDFGPNPRMSAGAIRSRYRVSEGQFRILVLGKDGEVKRDIQTFVPINEIFAQIDQMPMRREEVRRKTER